MDWTEIIENAPRKTLETWLIIAVGALSTTPNFSTKTPDQVFAWLFGVVVSSSDKGRTV